MKTKGKVAGSNPASPSYSPPYVLGTDIRVNMLPGVVGEITSDAQRGERALILSAKKRIKFRKMKAKFIKKTDIQTSAETKDRWECPACRKNPDQPECRFNLSPKKRGTKYNCRFCGIELLLDPYGD